MPPASQTAWIVVTDRPRRRPEERHVHAGTDAAGLERGRDTARVVVQLRPRDALVTVATGRGRGT